MESEPYESLCLRKDLIKKFVYYTLIGAAAFTLGLFFSHSIQFPKNRREAQQIVEHIKQQKEAKYAALSGIERELEDMSEDGKWTKGEVKDFEKLLSSVYSSSHDKRLFFPLNNRSEDLYTQIEEETFGKTKVNYDQLPRRIEEDWKLMVNNPSEGLDLEKTSIDEYVKKTIRDLKYKFGNNSTYSKIEKMMNNLVRDSWANSIYFSIIAAVCGLFVGKIYEVYGMRGF